MSHIAPATSPIIKVQIIFIFRCLLSEPDAALLCKIFERLLDGSLAVELLREDIWYNIGGPLCKVFKEHVVQVDDPIFDHLLN